MKIYNIIYELGLHHVPIVVPESSFYNVLDNLSEDFVIYKEFIDCSGTELKSLCSYSIENYRGVMQAVAFVSER